jgi:hypothetical protein
MGISPDAAPLTGQVPLPCFGEPLRMLSGFYCVTMRNFVSPELLQVAQGAADLMASDYPGSMTTCTFSCDA